MIIKPCEHFPAQMLPDHFPGFGEIRAAVREVMASLPRIETMPPRMSRKARPRIPKLKNASALDCICMGSRASLASCSEFPL